MPHEQLSDVLQQATSWVLHWASNSCVQEDPSQSLLMSYSNPSQSSEKPHKLWKSFITERTAGIKVLICTTQSSKRQSRGGSGHRMILVPILFQLVKDCGKNNWESKPHKKILHEIFLELIIPKRTNRTVQTEEKSKQTKILEVIQQGKCYHGKIFF